MKGEKKQKRKKERERTAKKKADGLSTVEKKSKQSFCCEGGDLLLENRLVEHTWNNQSIQKRPGGQVGTLPNS